MQVGVLTVFIWFVCLEQEYSQRIAILSYGAAFCALVKHRLFIPLESAAMRLILQRINAQLLSLVLGRGELHKRISPLVYSDTSYPDGFRCPTDIAGLSQNS